MTNLQCQNCLKYFSGGHDYSNHRPSCNGNDKQCAYCGTWFMTRGQRDGHVIKQHGGKS